MIKMRDGAPSAEDDAPSYPESEASQSYVTIRNGDALDELRKIPDASIDAIVTDPPYELGFMGKKWDGSGIAYSVELWREALRVLKPGGHLVAFGGTRTYHRMACAVEDAGFEIRDSLTWLYGCLDDQTEILVDGRWEQYRNVTEGRHALGYDLDRDEFSWQPIQRVVSFPHSDTAYRLVGDHTDQLVTRDHRCLVERGGSLVFEHAEEAARQREAHVPVLEDVQGLLAALPVPHAGAGRPQRDVFPGMLGGCGCGQQDGNTESARKPAPDMPDVRNAIPALAHEAARRSSTGVLAEVPGRTGRRPTPRDGIARPLGMDGGVSSLCVGEDDRRAEPGVEGRRDRLPQEGQLLGSAVRPCACVGSPDGPQRRLRDGASATGREGHRPTPDPRRGGASHGSRPDEQRTGQPGVVRDEPGSQAVRASRFTSTDLARFEPVHYDGIAWCVTVRTGAFVARRNGKVFVTGNSGFPKSLDVGKAIDKAGGGSPVEHGRILRAARERAGMTRAEVALAIGCQPQSVGDWEDGRARTLGEAREVCVPSEAYRTKLAELLGYTNDERRIAGVGRKAGPLHDYGHGEVLYGDAATDAARQWQGWGTALKPAVEPIVLARKPLSGTVAATVLGHGTGALNIDGTRTAGAPTTGGGGWAAHKVESTEGWDRPYVNGVSGTRPNTSGRWPANVLLTHGPDCADVCTPGCPVAELDAQSGKVGGHGGGTPGNSDGDNWRFKAMSDKATNVRRSEPGASRFFPTFRYQAKAPARERPKVDGIAHPTVKPLALMQWLVRLVTPPGGTVLDPFAGSGTTLQAAREEGFASIGIEREPTYLPLIAHRLGVEVAEIVDPLLATIGAAPDRDTLLALWRAHKDVWTPEYDEAVRDRLSEIESAA